MAAEKRPLIVVKKITIAAAGGHGGSWKVAFADFMTALMAFFLLMWLLGQADPVKKNVSDYFSTPSIVEYNFSNFGVELTLEKLFLDLMNEPLKVFQDFMTPMDHTPNFFSLGSKSIAMEAIQEQIGDFATNTEVLSDTITFDIPEKVLFDAGSANPSGHFGDIMQKVKVITQGLEDTEVIIDSVVFLNTIPNASRLEAEKIADQRLELMMTTIDKQLEHETVSLKGKVDIKNPEKNDKGGGLKEGFIRLRLQQKETKANGEKTRKLDSAFGKNTEENVYNNFVKKISNSKAKDR